MCWCAIPRNPPVPPETPALPAAILRETARGTARGQLLARVATLLAAHGILPYLSRSYMFFFAIGSCQDAEAQMKQWDLPLTSSEITYIDTRTAEIFLGTGSEHETLAYAELRVLLKTAMATIKANNRFAEAERARDVTRGAPE